MDNFDKIKYNTKYNKDNYTEIRFRIPKEQEDELFQIASDKGFSTINAYAKSLLIQENKEKISCDEIELLNSYRKCSNENKLSIRSVANTLESTSKGKSDSLMTG